MRRVALPSRTTPSSLVRAVPACRPSRARSATKLRSEQHLQEIEYHVSACWQGIQAMVLDLHLLQQMQRSNAATPAPATWHTLVQPIFVRLNAHVATLARIRRFSGTLLWEENLPEVEKTADSQSVRLLTQGLERAVQEFEEQCCVMLQLLTLLLEKKGSVEENGRAGGI